MAKSKLTLKMKISTNESDERWGLSESSPMKESRRDGRIHNGGIVRRWRKKTAMRIEGQLNADWYTQVS